MDRAGENSNHAQSGATLAAKLYRYKVLVAKRWWVLPLSMSIIVCLEAVFLKNQPESYHSNARMWISSGAQVPGVGSSEPSSQNFLPTQIELLQSPNILNRARTRLQTLKPDLASTDVRIEVGQSGRTDIIGLRAIGGEGRYTQAFLDAVMEEYLEYRREVRETSQGSNLQRLTDQLTAREKDFKEATGKLQKFQQDNALSLLTDSTGTTDTQLTKLNAELASLRFEAQQYERLTPEQQLEKNKAAPQGSTATDNGASAEFARLRQQIRLLKDKEADWAADYKPAHPRMVELRDQISALEKQAGILREDAATDLARIKKSLEDRIASVEATIRSLETKALETKQRRNDYESLKQAVERARTSYDRMADIVQQAVFTTRVSQETVQVMERAGEPFLLERNLPKNLAMGAIAGLMIGFGVLFLIDRFDDRLTTTGEINAQIGETLLGQIPELPVKKGDNLKLIEDDDERHAFAEAYRNLRSSLLFLDLQDFKPKTFVITSSIPSEGKSTVSSNLALTFANAGNRVLLIDADLRRGEIHKRFGLPNVAGLTELLRKQADYASVIKGTKTPGLCVLPRGKSCNSASELFLSPAMDALLVKAQSEFDYVLIDSAPILATDDTATLAPKIDGTIFVVRASFTSAKLVRTALGQLDSRGVNLLGLVFNRVSEGMPDYHYYKYAEYYASNKDGSTE